MGGAVQHRRAALCSIARQAKRSAASLGGKLGGIFCGGELGPLLMVEVEGVEAWKTDKMQRWFVVRKSPKGIEL